MPTDRLEIEFNGTLRGSLANKFHAECERRGIEPAALAADLLETIIKENLFAAVLDD